MHRGSVAVAANLASKPQRITVPGFIRSVLLSTESGATVMRDGIQLPAESAVVVALA